MAITKVWIDESQNECISCGACESIAGGVFEIADKAVVKADADLSAESEITDAASSCPSSVIAFELDGSGHRDN
jgi:ferredoxin